MQENQNMKCARIIKNKMFEVSQNNKQAAKDIYE